MCCGQLWLSPGDTPLAIKTELVARVRIHLHQDGEVTYAPLHETWKFAVDDASWQMNSSALAPAHRPVLLQGVRSGSSPVRKSNPSP